MAGSVESGMGTKLFQGGGESRCTLGPQGKGTALQGHANCGERRPQSGGQRILEASAAAEGVR